VGFHGRARSGDCRARRACSGARRAERSAPLIPYRYLAGGLAATALLGVGAFFLTRSRSEPDKPRAAVGKRQEVLAIARGELGHVGGDKYWSDANPAFVGSGADWCGGFMLWVYHQAGLLLGVSWKVQTASDRNAGFLFRLPQTNSPEPGDAVYIDQPFQHQGFVESVSPDGLTIHTIDGNQANRVGERDRPRSSITAFFSIAPLLAGEGVA
jgi:CHAP domain-containing protein